MKIAFSLEHFGPEQGGAERYAWGLAEWLARNGHELHVFARSVPDPLPGFCRVTRVTPEKRSGASREQAFSDSMAAALAGTDFDVVQGFNHTGPCDILRLGGGIQRAFEPWNAASAGGPLARWTKRWAYRLLPRYAARRRHEDLQFSDPHRHFIAVSRKVATDMAACYPAARDRIHTILNGVDATHFNPADRAKRRAAARARWNVAESDIALLFSSNNFRLKGLADLLRALPSAIAQVADPLRVLVVGRGRTDPFERLARSLGVRDRVVFCGPIPDPREGYAAADALIHPSYYDAFGFVATEAMACGLPLVLSRNCGAAEVVTDGCGAVLIDMPCPADRLAGAIARIAQPSFRADAFAHNRSIAERLNMEDNYRRVLSLYEYVAADKASRFRSACAPRQS